MSWRGARRQLALAWDSEDETGHTVIDAAQLRQLLSPYAATLRLVVVLMACDSANSGPWATSWAAWRRRCIGPASRRWSLHAIRSQWLDRRCWRRAVPVAARAAGLARDRGLGCAHLPTARVDEPGLGGAAALRQPRRGRRYAPPSFRPYRGLAAFAPRHSCFFFAAPSAAGAPAALRQLQSEGRPRFLVVTGASGTGKSSVVLAGLVPDLLARRSARARRCLGPHPAAELLRQILPAVSSAGFSPPLRVRLQTPRQELTQLAAADFTWEWR